MRHGLSFPRTRAAACLLLGFPLLAHAGLSFDETMRLARASASATGAAQRTGRRASLAATAATLPDPRLIVGLDNLPVTGADRFSTTADFMTMQRIGLMQEVPNAAKREARAAGRRPASSANARCSRWVNWPCGAMRRCRLAVYFAEERAAQLSALERENRLLQDTLDARIASGQAMPAERTMARIDALMIADRRDDALRDVERARASLRRWVGARAAEPLEGGPPALQVSTEQVRVDLHRHAEIAPYDAMQTMALAEAREADAEQRGDWGWEVVYSRRPQYGDMMSFQLVFDLPWDRERRQQPQLTAKLREAARIEAERADTIRRHGEEIDAQLAELKALDAQHARMQQQALALNTERVALALASFRSGRADLGTVRVARRETVETRLRLIDLDAQAQRCACV